MAIQPVSAWADTDRFFQVQVRTGPTLQWLDAQYKVSSGKKYRTSIIYLQMVLMKKSSLGNEKIESNAPLSGFQNRGSISKQWMSSIS
jgi:hypothetical protein